MSGLNRRGLLLGATAAAFTAAAASAAAPASAASRYSAARTARLSSYGTPTTVQALRPHLARVMQDLAVSSDGHYFVTQAEGNAAGTENIVISRLDAHGRTLDYMRLLGAGHGIGIDVQTRGGRPWVSLTWTDASAASGGRARDHVTFAYRASRAGWTRAECVSRLGLTVSPLAPAETLVKIDPARRLVACAQWEATPGQQVYTLRHLDDFRAGVDRPLGRVSVPIADGTFQGFATVNGTLYRYLGTAVEHGRMSATDPIRVQAFDWATGRKVESRTYRHLGQVHGAWRGGHAEPEGMTAVREHGRTSLVIGLVTGHSGDHRWSAFRFPAIGDR
jgi:hypothetical protein